MQARCSSVYSTCCEQDAKQIPHAAKITRVGSCTGRSDSKRKNQHQLYRVLLPFIRLPSNKQVGRSEPRLSLFLFLPHHITFVGSRSTCAMSLCSIEVVSPSSQDIVTPLQAVPITVPRSVALFSSKRGVNLENSGRCSDREPTSSS